MLGWVDMVRERGWKDIARGTECEEAVLLHALACAVLRLCWSFTFYTAGH